MSQRVPEVQESDSRWTTFRCPRCGYTKCFPKWPSGPGRPACTYGHHPIIMLPVRVEAIDACVHCFREDNCAEHPDHDGPECCCCERAAEDHTGCDCEHA